MAANKERNKVRNRYYMRYYKRYFEYKNAPLHIPVSLRLLVLHELVDAHMRVWDMKN